ncbi:MAG: polysaccharide pyruvyl transferase family protein [Oscillospiraceae bacterium]|nr:polysaccharide pyruvyl transferase family protein [Oscillospiraceae bacterium]
MKIFLDGYSDHNLGDDLMLFLAAERLSEHEIYIGGNMPNIENAYKTNAKSGFDCYLKITGSGFKIYNNLGILYRMRDMARERRYAKTRAALGCNISGFINSAAEKTIRANLRQYDFITVRDSVSFDYIKKNIPSVKCEQYPDIVFSLPDKMIPDVPCEKLLGISVMRGADYGHLARVADRYIEKTGNGVLLLCFDTGKENDVSAAEEIYRLSQRQNMIEIIKYETVSGMLSEMKRCGVILGMRFHSCVLSARMNIPFVPIVRSDKADALLPYVRDIHAPEGFDLENVLESILNAGSPDFPAEVFIDAKKHLESFNKFLSQL